MMWNIVAGQRPAPADSVSVSRLLRTIPITPRAAVADEKRKRKAERSSHDNKSKSKNKKHKKANKAAKITTTARSVESIGIKSVKSVTRTKIAKSIRISGKTPPNPNTRAVVTPSPSKVKVECPIYEKVVTTYLSESGSAPIDVR
jgi:hypothetical protein